MIDFLKAHHATRAVILLVLADRSEQLKNSLSQQTNFFEKNYDFIILLTRGPK